MHAPTLLVRIHEPQLHLVITIVTVHEPSHARCLHMLIKLLGHDEPFTTTQWAYDDAQAAHFQMSFNLPRLKVLATAQWTPL